MECLTMVGEKLLDYTLAPMARQVGYLIFYDSNVKELKEKAKNLQHARETVQQRVDAAFRDGDEIYNGVHAWLQKVDEMTRKVEGHIQDEHHKKTGCSGGSFPNLWMRHQLSRKSKKMVQEIEILKNERKFEHVSYRKAPNLIQNLSSTIGDEDFGSRVEILDAIMEALRDPNVNKIGVYGLGGVGKSTLVNQVAKKAQQEFDAVVMAIITQNPEVEKIQGQIADMLGLNLSNMQSLIGRASHLLERLKNEKNVLFILDDLWGELNWDEIGIPSPEEHSKKISISSEMKQRTCKYLVTSRDRDVLSKLNSQKYFFVRPLQDVEAWKLFKEKAMLDESIGNADLLSIAHQVVEECGGLPLAIVTVASSLKNKGISEWKVVLQELRNPSPTGMQNAIYKSIEVSYQNLKDDLLQSLFLLCGMFGQVSISDLFKHSFGLDLFKNIPKVEYARYKFDSCVHKLKDTCLLLDTDNFNYFQVHDVVRDVALMIAFHQQHCFVKINEILEELPEEEQLKNCKTMILRFCVLNDLERLCCPNLTFLLINNENPSLKLSDNLFEGMPILKVLDLTRMKFESLPSSISLLSTLRTLCLDQCSLRKIEVIGKLKGLKVLSFLKSDIKQLPQELGELSQLQLLDLTGCRQLKLIPSNTLLSLKKLEELYMEDSFVNWDVIDQMDQQQSNATVAELEDLPLLTKLVAQIPDERMLPKVLTFERLQKYKILIGNVWDWSSETETSRILKLWLNTSIHLRDDIKRLLDTVEELHIGKLKGAKNLLPSLNNDGLSPLKHLYLIDNDEIQCVIDSLRGIHPIDLFPNLESMILQNVMNIEKFCNGTLSGESFSKLKIIKVKNCGNLRSLLSASIARGLPQLVEIELKECFRMEGVVYDDEKAAGILQFPKLCSLTLHSLPQLLGFHYDGNVLGTSDALFCEKVMFPSLEKVTINDLQKLNVISNRLMGEDNTHHSSILDKMKETWHSSVADVSFCNLKTLKVTNCEGISKVLSFILLNFLNNLEELEVEGCKSVEVVFDLEKITGEKRHVVPNCHLRKLILFSLPNLKHVWSKDPRGILDFQNLSIIKAAECQCLKYLLPISVAKALPDLQELALQDCTGLEYIVAMEEGLDTTIRFMFPKVTLLWLWNMPKFKGFYAGGYITKWPQLSKLVYLRIQKEVNCLMSKDLCFSELPFKDGPQALAQQSFSAEEVIPNLQELVLDCDDSTLVNWLSEHSKGYISKIKVLELQLFQEEQMSLSYSFFQRISKVESLFVKNNSFEEIFPYEDLAGDGTEHGNAVWVKNLYLVNLPKLRQICKEGNRVRLNLLLVQECPCLLNLVPSSVILDHLTSLYVYKCEGLLYLVTPSTAKSLSQLSYMEIEECYKIKEIVADKVNVDAEDGDHEITFSKMKIIKLISLPLLESFASGNYAFKFPSLENTIICECPNLKIFSKGVSTTQRLRKVQVELEDRDWYWEDDLNKTIQKMYANKVGLRSFELLKQEEFPELKELWQGQVSTKEFKNLRSVVVDSCEFVSNVVSFNVLKALINLEELEVKNCSNAEVVFHLDGKDIDEKNIILTTKLKKLILSGLSNLKHVWNKDYRAVTFKNLKVVHVFHCESLSYLFPASVAKGLTQLGELQIDDCGIEEIVAKEEGHTLMYLSFVFPKLTSLHIAFVPQLKRFYPGKHTAEWPVLKELSIFIEGEMKVFGTYEEGSLDSLVQLPIFLIEKVFPNLETLCLHNKDDILDWLGQFSIEHFHRLKILELHFFLKEQDGFPYWLVQRIPNLFQLSVGYSYFKEIFSNEGEQTNGHLRFKALLLEQLPKLKYICKERNQLDTSLKNLETLRVNDCGGLTNLVPSSVSFNNLANLEVTKCVGLLHLVTLYTAKSFVQLKILKIMECYMIKEIVANEADDETGDEIIFSNLKILELQQLTSLICFSFGNNEFKFPSLEKVTVSMCPAMRTFSQKIPNTPSLKRVQGLITSYWEGNLNASINMMYTLEGSGNRREKMNGGNEDSYSQNFSPVSEHHDESHPEVPAPQEETRDQRIPKLEEAPETEVMERGGHAVEPPKPSSTMISEAALFEEVYAQSKDENTGIHTKASLSDALGRETEDRIAFMQGKKASTQDQGVSSDQFVSSTDMHLKETTSEVALSSFGMALKSVSTRLPEPPVSVDSSITTTPPYPNYTNSTTDVTFPMDLKKFRDIIELNDEDIALVKQAVARYPNLLEIKGNFSARFYGLAYKTLADLLQFLSTESTFTITQERERMFQVLCDEAIQFGFDRTWVQEMRKRIARNPEVDRAQRRLMELRQEMDMLEEFLLGSKKCFGFM